MQFFIVVEVDERNDCGCYWIVYPSTGLWSRMTCDPENGPVLTLYMLRAKPSLVMSTKSAYRAILRELYKVVCILPYPTSSFLPSCVFSQLAQGSHEVGQLRRTSVPFSSPPSPGTLTTTRKMSSHSYILSACTR